MSALSLLPIPRELSYAEPGYTLASGRRIVLEGAPAADLLFTAERLQNALRAQAGIEWELAANPAGPANEIGAVLRVAPETVSHPQGYELSVGANGIVVNAGSPAGVFYAVCTLIQIVEQAGASLPGVSIADWPDFAARGVMLDISRDKVPTLATTLELVDQLAGWKINQVQLYIEHTFAYRAHPEVWEHASPFTGEDILRLDAFCRERFIELVPNQNSFGHMERWLIHPRYAPLAEVEGDFETPWGRHPGPFSLAPLQPGSLELVSSLYDELLPHFSSRQFNVGLDETFDLGQGQTKAACEERGSGRVYLDFLLKVYEEVRKRDHRMQFWGDIIVQHPELIAELPRDLIALEWGYEANHPFAEHAQQFAAAGLDFYVCPGTSSWCSIAGRTDNAIGNLLSAAEHGRANGATGYLITDWGDRGHWQTLPVSYLGFVAGAAYSWALDANRKLDVPVALGTHAFHDRAGVMGKLAYDLGNIYREAGIEPPNGSALFWVMQLGRDDLGRFQGLDPENLLQAREKIAETLAPLGSAQIDRPDAALLAREFKLAGWMLTHAADRALFLLSYDAAPPADELQSDLAALIDEHRAVWLERNRPGGLKDSAARLERAGKDYAG